TFKISDTLKQIRNAYFGLYSPEGKYVYKQEFILEPGELELDLKKGDKKSTISGGKYNDLIYTPLKSDEAYANRKKALSDFSNTLTQESFQIDSVRERYSEFSKAVKDFELNYYQRIFNSPKDTLAQLLVFHKLGYKDAIEPRLDAFENQFGKD
ncbi:hypothetical protein, partial [Flavivirga rizhaonensis]|uniref:hypothetical protein n=1 Tax=Flavivirga rizhaonensis TaxID=2559571 RepID=UPI001477753D